jgi:hypothetical protein
MKPRSNFTLFLLIAFGILACAFAVAVLLAPSGIQRPDIEKALDDFTARYATTAVTDVRITRDEATTRTFEFDYRNKATGKLGKLEVHYLVRDDGKWEIRPEPPKQLP